jgi:TPR repeat protein
MRPMYRHLAWSFTLALAALAPPALTAVAQASVASQLPTQSADVSNLDIATLQQRAAAGDAAAQDMLGYRYTAGLGVPQDYSQAFIWFSKAAAQLDATGSYDLAQMYARGQGVARDDSKALGEYTVAAGLGNIAAQAWLGYMYLEGQGVPQDLSQAFFWYNQAAQQGDAASQDNLGTMYQSGQGVPRDNAQALAWYRKAANQDFADAQLKLGEMYRSGTGVAQDSTQAFFWYRQAAGGGLPIAEHAVGLAYKLGNGVAPDADQARAWFQKSAAQGLQASKDELAKLDVPAPAPNVPAAASVPVPSRGIIPETPAQPAGAATASPIPHNYALIFATDDYAHWPHLANPIPDADAVNQTLASLYGFQVEELRNATSDQMMTKLREYLQRKFEPQDQLLIFFSGHGYFDEALGQGYIVPADAPLLADDPNHHQMLAYDEIMHYVNRIPATHIVLIADACFAGTLDRRIADGGLRGDPSDYYARATLPELLARKEPKRTRRYFASGGKDFVPDGQPGHHSPFISAFLTTLNQAADRKGYATLDDIQQGLDDVKPEPRWGDIQDENEPGADFLLLTPGAIAQLSKTN